MAGGGSRIGSGRKSKGVKEKSAVPEGWQLRAELANVEEGLSPLEFMLAVMRDDTLPRVIRAQMAVAAAPYRHAKPGDVDQSKGQQRKAAAEGVIGKFAPPAPPRLVSSSA